MKYFLIALMMWTIATPAIAQEAPVEISASKTLEWNRKAKTYTARGDAIAKQGAMEVHAAVLTATYSEANGGTDISRLMGSGGVTIISSPYTVTGDQADYDLKTGHAVMTGGDLKIITPTETLTARDNITFDTNQNKLTANGDAVALRGTDTLKADTLSAFFVKGTDGKLTLQKMTANGKVSIKTARETVTGEKGIYDVMAGKATLTGKIIIEQGASRIEGTRAEVDLKTGISQLFAEGTPSTQGRVKGVFYPKAK